jgi:hypothetical protein
MPNDPIDSPSAASEVQGRVPSPQATGGAGGTVEARVTAILLARLLRGDRVPGLALAPTRVRLQQTVAGALLDDIVIDATEPSAAVRTIEYQSKRQLSPGKGNDDFVDIVERCLVAIDGDSAGDDAGAVAAGRRRFGIASHPSTALADLRRVTDIARSHESPDGFGRVIENTARAGVRQRYTQLQATIAHTRRKSVTELVAGPTDEELRESTWRVARALHVWQLDAEPHGVDVLAAQDRLADLLPAEADPASLFNHLVGLAGEWSPQAGSVTLNMLRTRLEGDGFALQAHPARRRSFETARTATVALLNPEAARLGRRLSLARVPLRSRVIEALADHDSVLLTGRAGVGKSILARLVGADVSDEGDVVLALNLTGRTGGLHPLQEELGTRLDDAFSGAPIGHKRLLIVDGAEQALTDAGALLNAVLSALPTDRGTAPPWQVLLTSRDEAASAVAELVEQRSGHAPRQVQVAELDDPEVEQILTEFPELTPVGRNPRARALLLRRPYLVELLVRGVATAGLPPAMVGEEDLLPLVYDRLVRRSDGALPGQGLPDARADVFQALADAAVANTLPVRLDGSDALARPGLASDDVISRVGLRWQFAHDVLLDYAVANRLLEADGTALLSAAAAPRRLLRAARLRMQRQLADALASGTLTTAWTAMLQEAQALAATDGPRWADVPWEALLHLGPSRAALAALQPHLLQNDAAGLVRLLDVTSRLGRRSAVTSRGAADTVLDPALSAPPIDLLAQLAHAVPEGAEHLAARLVHAHLEAVSVAGQDLDEHLLRAAQLPDALLGWTGDDAYGDVHDLTIGSLAMLGRHLMPEHEQWLLEAAKTRPHRVAEAVESPLAATSLAEQRPDLLLRLAGLYYLGVGLHVSGPPLEVGERPPSEFGYGSPFDDDEIAPDPAALEHVRDHDPRQSRHLPAWPLGPLGDNQANSALGPFAALLRADSVSGLRLVGAVVDAATAGRTALEAEGSLVGDAGTASLHLDVAGATHLFTGPESTWRWYRRTSTGPNPALSALMALRAWAVKQIHDGVPPVTVRDTLLTAGRSLAFPAVAVSVLVDAIDLVHDELDPFLVHPLVWHMEIARTVGETGGTALEIPGATRLRWTFSHVAMQLVLQGDAERREHLAGLADSLLENAGELGDDAQLIAQRWACELDISRYETSQRADGIAIAVRYPDEVVAALAASGGAAATRSLERASLTFRACELRDHPDTEGAAVQVWEQARALCDNDGDGESDAIDPLGKRGDLSAAAAAALVASAAAGAAVADTDLQEATAVLLDGAQVVAAWAPPTRDPSAADAEEPGRVVHDMLWDQGFDRSVATGLAVLVHRDELRARAGVDHDTLASGVIGAAASPFDEARLRVAHGLKGSAKQPCTGDDWRHATILKVARRLVATAGYGQLSQSGYGYPRATLPEPLETVVADTDEPVMDLASAAFAVELLSVLAANPCEHGVRARALLEALVEHDTRAWPRQYARRRYSRTTPWRKAIDGYLADRVLSGDVNVLIARIAAFAGVHEELAPLLAALADRADDPDRVRRLHDLWPQVLDRLLPDRRSLAGIPGPNRRPHEAYSRDVEELDDALLLLPPTHANDWPLEDTLKLGARWVAAYQDRADRVDRTILFASRILGLSDLSVSVVLGVAGENVAALQRESRYLVPFLGLALKEPGASAGSGQLRILLDRLAANGHEAALQLQQDLET